MIDLGGVDERQREREWLTALGHELNNSVNALVLGVTLAERLLSGDVARARRHLEAARKNAVLVGRLVADHLEVTLLDQSHLEILLDEVELGPFLREAVETSGLPGPLHSIRFALAEAVTVLADPGRLQQILTNLLSNAVKYSTPGPLTLGSSREGERALIWLKDEGPGIAPCQLAMLFERYSRLPSRQKGLGLGLWVSREMARLMGGELWATSEGGSSTFYLSLPAV